MIRDLLKNNQYIYCPENPEKCEDHRKASGGFWEKTRNVWCRSNQFLPNFLGDLTVEFSARKDALSKRVDDKSATEITISIYD